MDTLQALENAVGLNPTPNSAEEPLGVYECIYVGIPRKQPLNAGGDGDGAPLVKSESENGASKSKAAEPQPRTLVPAPARRDEPLCP